MTQKELLNKIKNGCVQILKDKSGKILQVTRNEDGKLTTFHCSKKEEK